MMDCSPECPTRQGLEAENLPGPTVPEVCKMAAAALVMQGVVLDDCPLQLIPLE